MKIRRLTLCHSKGGVGKTTLAILLIEFLLALEKRISFRDGDNNKLLEKWAAACDRDIVSHNPEVEIIDTEGAPGAAVSWLKQSHVLITPFKPNMADAGLIAEWFPALEERFRQRFIFVPTHTGVAREQKAIITEVREIIRETKVGILVRKYAHDQAVATAWRDVAEQLDDPNADLVILEDEALMAALAHAVAAAPEDGELAAQLASRPDLYADDTQGKLMAAIDCLPHGRLLEHLGIRQRDAIYPKLLGGTDVNFFDEAAHTAYPYEITRRDEIGRFHDAQLEAAALCTEILKRADIFHDEAAALTAAIQARRA